MNDIIEVLGLSLSGHGLGLIASIPLILFILFVLPPYTTNPMFAETCEDLQAKGYDVELSARPFGAEEYCSVTVNEVVYAVWAESDINHWNKQNGVLS